jgi:hypothetical protein
MDAIDDSCQVEWVSRGMLVEQGISSVDSVIVQVGADEMWLFKPIVGGYTRVPLGESRPLRWKSR